jgi:hypothetical protein
MAAQRGEEAATAAAGWYGRGRSWQEPARSRGGDPLLAGSRSEVSAAGSGQGPGGGLVASRNRRGYR